MSPVTLSVLSTQIKKKKKKKKGFGSNHPIQAQLSVISMLLNLMVSYAGVCYLMSQQHWIATLLSLLGFSDLTFSQFSCHSTRCSFAAFLPGSSSSG